jgi:hypothetical protein
MTISEEENQKKNSTNPYVNFIKTCLLSTIHSRAGARAGAASKWRSATLLNTAVSLP